jgi:ubiquinone biosynthesis protein
LNHPAVIERLERNSHRARQIGAVLVKYGLADWLRKIPGPHIQEWLHAPEGEAISELSRPERIRLALTELGTTFIKLGQMLSTRPDLIGRELARELQKLQSATPPEPRGVAHATVKKELGHPPQALFAHFDPEPFASASIAQVHHARLHSGEKIVVKIQKRGIEQTIEADLSLLADLARLAETHVNELQRYRPVALIRQFTKTLRDELDFTRERHNLETFRHNFAEDDSVHFPRPWPEFSSRRVLTMEQMNGILLSHTAKLRAQGADLNEFARRGATMYLEMIFRDSFFHADPHPGNLMLQEGEVVGVLDCGMVQRLDEGLRQKLEDVLLAIIQVDAEALTDSVWLIGSEPPIGSKEALRSDLVEFLSDYANQSINEINLSQALTSMTDLIRRNQIFLPPGVSLLLRTLIELEGTAQLLNPAFSLLELIQPYYQKDMARRCSPAQVARRLGRDAHAWGQLLHRLPHDLNDLTEKIRAGALSVHLEHRRLDPVANRLVRGLVVSSLFLGSSLLWSMKAPPLIRGVSLFGVIGYALSLVISVKLFRAIRRSEASGPADR